MMGKNSLLDCTLRDGGYLNDWRFGEAAISGILHRVEASGAEIVEMGFLKNEPFESGRAVFNSMQQIKELVREKKPGTLYALMCELVNPVPPEQLEPCDGTGADILRMILWKTKRLPDGRTVDALDEGYDYCKAIVDKGYRLCVQPVRVNQYSDEEFTALMRRFAELAPMAIYVVDSWGTQNEEELLHYMRLADKVLPKEIALGHHGHNNLMQTPGVAKAMLREGFKRDIILDASVFGIGRGAGNLSLELIAKYMNEHCGKSYAIPPMLEVYEQYLKEIFNKESWGYSIPFFLTASYNCNPMYARYLGKELGQDADTIRYVLTHLSAESKIIYNRAEADQCLEKYRQSKSRV